MSRARLGLICAASSRALGCSGLAAGADEPSRAALRGAAAARADAARRPADQAARPASADLLGSDGRLTVLLLGSDERKGIVGERTDAIIVATVDPASGKVAMVSLPRDTVNVPIAPGRRLPRPHQHALLRPAAADGQAQGGARQAADALAYAFDTEIDHYALVDFGGLVQAHRRHRRRRGDARGAAHRSRRCTSATRGLRLKAGTPRLDGQGGAGLLTLAPHLQRLRPLAAPAAGHPGRRREGPRARSASCPRSSSWRARRTDHGPAPARGAGAARAGRPRPTWQNPRSVVLEPVRWARRCCPAATPSRRACSRSRSSSIASSEAGSS